MVTMEVVLEQYTPVVVVVEASSAMGGHIARDLSCALQLQLAGEQRRGAQDRQGHAGAAMAAHQPEALSTDQSESLGQNPPIALRAVLVGVHDTAGVLKAAVPHRQSAQEAAEACLRLASLFTPRQTRAWDARSQPEVHNFANRRQSKSIRYKSI